MDSALLEEKKKKLEKLKASRSEANCSSTVSKASDVFREEEIEELENEIKKLEEQHGT